MSRTEAKAKSQKERDYYEPIKKKLENLLSKKTDKFHLEITADKRFSNKLKAEINKYGHRDIIFSFLKDAAPDITGFITEESSSRVVVVEIKNEEIKIDDIYQTKKYAELFEAKYALLISTKEIPEEIKRLSNVVYKLLSGGYGYEKITLVHFHPDTGEFADWFEKNPFEK